MVGSVIVFCIGTHEAIGYLGYDFLLLSACLHVCQRVCSGSVHTQGSLVQRLPMYGLALLLALLHTTSEGPTSEMEPTVGPWHLWRDHGQLELLSMAGCLWVLLLVVPLCWRTPTDGIYNLQTKVVISYPSLEGLHTSADTQYHRRPLCTLHKRGSHTKIR
jgi:hypothetical protein